MDPWLRKDIVCFKVSFLGRGHLPPTLTFFLPPLRYLELPDFKLKCMLSCTILFPPPPPPPTKKKPISTTTTHQKNNILHFKIDNEESLSFDFLKGRLFNRLKKIEHESLIKKGIEKLRIRDSKDRPAP